MKKIIAVLILLAFSCCQCEEGQGSYGPESSIHDITPGSAAEKMNNMEEKITLLETRLQNSEKEVLKLRSLIEGKPQVAFSAALRTSGSGNIGPFSIDTALQYKKIFSNTGNGYNPSTGIFTAMVKGMYFFRFSMFATYSPPPNAAVSLMKNSEKLVTVWDIATSDTNDMGSNAVVIPLEVGDNVYVSLHATRLIYDDTQNYNTFTGFLLFTM